MNSLNIKLHVKFLAINENSFWEEVERSYVSTAKSCLFQLQAEPFHNFVKKPQNKKQSLISVSFANKGQSWLKRSQWGQQGDSRKHKTLGRILEADGVWCSWGLGNSEVKLFSNIESLHPALPPFRVEVFSNHHILHSVRKGGSFPSSAAQLFLTSFHTSYAFHTYHIQITTCTIHHYTGQCRKSNLINDYHLQFYRNCFSAQSISSLTGFSLCNRFHYP